MSANLDLAFSSFSKALSIDIRPNKGDDGWRSFLKALEVRSDVTHPKDLMRFDVASAVVPIPSLKFVNEAGAWFWDEWSRLMDAAVEARRGTVSKKGAL